MTSSSGSSAAAAAIQEEDRTDSATWQALMNTPIVPVADHVRSADLYVPAHPDAHALDMTAFPGAAEVDPFKLIAPDIAGMNANIKNILGVDHPVLSTVAKYFFNWDGGKKIRPAMVMLMSHAVNAHVAAVHAGAQSDSKAGAAVADTKRDETVSYTADGLPPHLSRILAQAQHAASLKSSEGERSASVGQLWLPPAAVLPLQSRIAEITEMIHTASLLHDDVIDMADTRRGISSVNSAFGNKLAVLAGDFLLARASVCLARLRNIPVVELLSTVIEHLVKGEVMQMKTALRNEAASRAAVEMYLRKTYYKTGSLIANSCRAIAMLGWYPDYVCEAAFKYGMHVGIAFQLVDDMLDFQGTQATLGKPAMNDMKSGLATAPVLFAAQQFPVLLPIIERKFSAPGDVDTAVKFVMAADGLTATKRLAIAHGQLALAAIEPLVDSPSRTALAALVARILSRDH